MQTYPITDRGGLWDCAMLEIKHCPVNGHIDGGDVVIFTHRMLSTAQKQFSASSPHFYQTLNELRS
jgi:hypothetical protein